MELITLIIVTLLLSISHSLRAFGGNNIDSLTVRRPLPTNDPSLPETRR